jgi:uncharacterized membrane protein YgdD (TMEM256/DUF423 family)
MHVLRLRLAALIGFTAVLLGALGAHGPVHEQLKAAGELEHWQTALHYHLPHALLLAMLALHGGSGRAHAWAWRLVFAGILLFSGSLYVLALTQATWLGKVTPFGGLSLMLGWLLLAVGARRA